MTPVIEALQLTKFYGTQRGIEDVFFSVNAGEIFGCLGPNGSGKTTTIRLVMNLIRPTRGYLRLFGEDIQSAGSKIRSRIGYLPGEFGLYDNYTPRQVLQLYRDLSRSDAPIFEWVCEAMQFVEVERRVQVKTLSKGLKQKLAIVQALQHNPDLIILDEPTGGLDPLAQNAFYGLLHELKSQGKTIFFSSHILSEVYRVCDRVIVLREGRVALSAGVSELVNGAARLLWVKPRASDLGPFAPVPQIAGAVFLRREEEWYLYRCRPSDSFSVLADLARMQPLDFRFEAALEESFLSLYQKAR